MINLDGLYRCTITYSEKKNLCEWNNRQEIIDFIESDIPLSHCKDCPMPAKTTKWETNNSPIDLKNSPDYTCLYGVKVDKCMVRIHYEDNRRKGRSWDIELTNNKFIIFPSTCMYYLNNNQKDSLNFVQTITYEYI